MSWSDRVMASLDERAAVLPTSRGDVQLAREGEGPPVLAIHGGPGGFDFGLAYARHLLDGGCELLAPSRPGYLRTPLRSGARPEDQADLYAASLDSLDIERAAILGVSSGGISALQFAARHPDRTIALFLDSAILMPHTVPLGPFRRAVFESSFFVWLSYQLVTRRAELMTRFAIEGMLSGVNKEQAEMAVKWITADPGRLRSLQEQFMSTAPQKYRKVGWANDKANEATLSALPITDVMAPTLIAHGANDAVVPVFHATNAAGRISGSELIIVEEGHHLLSLSRNYGEVAQRQLELVHGACD